MTATRRSIRPPALDFWIVTLFIVFLAALAVRLYGIDWDDGADLHPDELFIAKIVLIDRIRFDWPPDLAQLLDPARSGLNPRSADPATGEFREFAYGALPLWVTDATAWLLTRITRTDWNGLDHAYLVGRVLSALLSALTVVPVAVIGVYLAGRTVGILAALFAALAPMSIQLAHFFTTDSWLTFFVALCLLSCVRAANVGSTSSFAAAGAMFGLALATKGSVLTLAVPIAVSLLIDTVRRLRSEAGVPVARSALVRLAAAMIAAGAAFFAFEPYALLRPGVYFQSLKTQADIVSGAFDVPFTRVYAGTFPVGYQLEQFLRWGYGPVAGALSVAGIFLILKFTLRRTSSTAIVLSSWLGAYSIVLLIADVKFLRYLEPLAPVFAVGAALALVRLRDTVLHSPIRIPRVVVPALALGLAFAWTAAFLSIYAHENSRLAASRWIYASVPPGATLTAEYWDDALPRSLSYSLSPAAFGFGTIILDLYRDLPPAQASDALYASIRRADYIIQSSQRVESATRAAPWRYPVQGRYFDQLERGQLGFDRVASFARPPSIGDVAIDDRAADESFINYDHPRVEIFERAGPIARASYDAVMSWALQRPWYPSREPDRPTLLLEGPVGENPSVNDARWSAAITSETLGAAAVWVLLLVILQTLGLPLARILFPRFPDCGWGLARVFLLVVAAYPVWLGASLELFRFRATWVAVSIVAVGFACWWLSARTRWSINESSWQMPGRAWIFAEASFWLVFLLFLGFRMLNPDSWHPIWGGEKPMEFAQINAIERSAFFPPYDPWYSDGYVNYYYYGFYLVSFLFKATGIPTEVGFNLALPTMMGMLASGGFSVVAMIARGLTRSPRLAIIGGCAGAIALCLLGNLSALRGIVVGVPAQVDPFLEWTWSGSRAIDNVITEFPYFTGLYADLHAHVVALPITVLVIAVSLAVARSRLSLESNLQRSSRFVDWTRLVILALLLGTLSATNAWDVPVYATLAVASVFMATASDAPLTRRLAALVSGTVLLLGGAFLLFLPFHLHFVALFSQVALVRDPTDLYQFLSHLGGQVVVASVGLTVLLSRKCKLCTSRIPWPGVVLAAGALGLIVGSVGARSPYLFLAHLLLVGAIATPPILSAWRLLRDRSGQALGAVRLEQLALIACSLASVVGVIGGRTVFGLLLGLGTAAAVGWLVLRLKAEKFVCLLLAAALFTAAGAEIIVIADDLIGTTAYRMNTVFKFYNQVWVLLSLANAGLFALMILEARLPRRSSATSEHGRVQWSRAGVAATLLIAIASLTYPALATVPRLEQRFTPGTNIGTLNAFEWMNAGAVPVFGDPQNSAITFAGDAAAIEWLITNVDGSPVIAEASIGPYRCNGSRISSATGFPTIIGWERHEQQQRYPDTLPARVDDVRALYTSTNLAEKASILRRYNVEYVVVGDLERLYPIANNECTPSGSQMGIAAFDKMVGTTLEVAHSAQGTTIYRVLPVRGR